MCSQHFFKEENLKIVGKRENLSSQHFIYLLPIIFFILSQTIFHSKYCLYILSLYSKKKKKKRGGKILGAIKLKAYARDKNQCTTCFRDHMYQPLLIRQF